MNLNDFEAPGNGDEPQKCTYCPYPAEYRQPVNVQGQYIDAVYWYCEECAYQAYLNDLDDYEASEKPTFCEWKHENDLYSL